MPFPLFVVISSAIALPTAAAAALLARRPQLAVLVALAGATGLLLFHGPAYFDYYADDAYITLRYSRHLADGLGPNWNATGHVEGYAIFSDPRLWERYEVRAANLDGRWFHFLQRKDTVAELQVRGLR